MKAAALRGALSDRARNERIHVVDGLVKGDKPSTKAALAALAGLADRGRFLVVLERTDATTWLSLRNAPEVHIVAVDQLNTYDVLASEDVVFTRGAYDEFVARHGKGGAPATAAVADTPAATGGARGEGRGRARGDDRAEDRGCHRDRRRRQARPAEGCQGPAEERPGPEGLRGHGRRGRPGLYREPEDEGYDVTAADFWFKSAEDAEAAGFSPKEGDK